MSKKYISFLQVKNKPCERESEPVFIFGSIDGMVAKISYKFLGLLSLIVH
jgi:predicted transcriptional regulator